MHKYKSWEDECAKRIDHTSFIIRDCVTFEKNTKCYMYFILMKYDKISQTYNTFSGSPQKGNSASSAS